MRILFVADGRSPIALNWIQYFLERDHEVHLASTFPCAGDERLASLDFIPVALSSVKAVGGGGGQKPITAYLQTLLAAPARTLLRQWLSPFTLPSAARRLQEVIERVQPELVHAMRIPYEGMLAALAHPVIPCLVSVWGNDFTLHAPSTPWMGRYTRLALQRADALHTDCRRDARLARAWGFGAGKPLVVLPGSGGVQLDLFRPAPHPPPSQPEHGASMGIDPEWTIINPRGVRAYVRNDTFFRAIPLVLQRQPRARFLCPAMAGEPQAQRWLDKLGIAGSVALLPRQSRPQMAELFRNARVVVSPSAHDGTPNSLLEAMACGCLPVAGDIESLREWIIPGVNGLLFDPSDPQALAQAILIGLQEGELCRRARQVNARLVTERAAYQSVMGEAESFYRAITRKSAH